MALNGFLNEGQNFYNKMAVGLAQYYQLIYDYTYARNLDCMQRQGGNTGFTKQAQSGGMYNWINSDTSYNQFNNK